MPIPIENRLQRDVKITSTYPASLTSLIDWKLGMITNIPVRPNGEPDIVFGYEFEYVLHEEAAIRREAPAEAPPDLANFLHVDMSEATRGHAKQLLALIGANPEREPFENARSIYRWIQSNILFALPPAGFACDILRSGLGECGTQSGLFVGLCRLLGIPARGCVGDHFKRVFGPAQRTVEAETMSNGDAPVFHSWAEFYSPPHGWVSVEIAGTGKKAISATVVPDADLRGAIHHGIEAFENEQFGDMIPLRIFVSDEVFVRPTFPCLQDPTDRALQQRIFRATSHRIRYAFSI